MALAFSRRWAAAACIGLSAFAGSGSARAAEPPMASATNPDQRIAEAIARKLSATPQVNGYQVEVTCEHGVVEVTGSVKDPQQAAAISGIVRSVNGVTRVVDKTIVSPLNRTQAVEALPSPAQIPVPMQMNQGPPMAPQGLPTEMYGGGGGGNSGGQQNAPMMSGPGCGPNGGGSPYMQNNGNYNGPPQGMMEGYGGYGGGYGDPTPIGAPPTGGLYDAAPPKMPPYAWPTYAPYNNYSRVAYPQDYPANAFPFIGPFYPFPKVPPGWRSVKLEWEDGSWYYGRTATHRDWWRIRYW